ncbi:AP-3 complex subunit sigma-1 [Grus japonensis]|uniref:AP-3 complex subunit sigma-1 n=1 Tax=Grus japonensis TaxID=30415 RepID=A0ABC9Y6J4_GRUJA
MLLPGRRKLRQARPLRKASGPLRDTAFPSGDGEGLIGGSDNKLIYRHYATLYFVFCVDSSESELGILDLIQVFVETLDKCFENVCELDLIFHVDKVHNILAEMVMGGMVLETNMNEIVTQIDAQNKLEKSETFIFQSPRQDR